MDWLWARDRSRKAEVAASARSKRNSVDLEERLESTHNPSIEGHGPPVCPSGRATCEAVEQVQSARQNDMSNHVNIGRGELEILRYISDHHPLSVRELTAQMAEVKGHARTTILTVVERLRKKGHLTRKRIDGVYRYSPCIPKANLLQKLIREFVETTLEGSAAPFVSYLVQEAKLTERELAELKQFVRDLAEQKDRKK